MFNTKWNDINWAAIEETVFKVQQQIYLSSHRGDLVTARNFQNYLLNMMESKYLAVKIVTDNSGSKTPGVDRWIASNDDDKFQLVNELNLDGTSNLVRRVYISKPGTNDMRPLGIPTIVDRCKQNFCKLALEPEAEARFESNSFGFRPGRSAIDAISKIRAHLIFKGPCYVLDTDIRKCFDRINHYALRTKVGALPIIDQQIDAWLRTGILDNSDVFIPSMGTPQGGIISPLLANIALDGLQKSISDYVHNQYGHLAAQNTYFIRYADDFVVLGPSLEIIQNVKTICENVLKYMGLELKSEATRIIHTLSLTKNENKTTAKSQHFDFLGFRFKQRYLGKHQYWKAGGKTTNIRTLVLINPSRIQRHKASINALIKKINNIEELIESVNIRITGWCNYFKNSDAKEYGDLPRKMDTWINSLIRKWIKKHCKLRGKVSNFWKQDSKDWILYCKKKSDGKEITLIKYNSFKWSIYNYKAINASFSPYQLDYKKKREMLV